MIPYFRLRSTVEELQALTNVHNSSSWVTGKEISEVEIELKKMLRSSDVIMTSSGYSALFISIKALGIKGKKIIVPCISTCFAMSNAVIASGNEVAFCDVNLQDGNCDLNSVSELVKSQNIKYIISPNHAGNISGVAYFKNELKLIVIEDACQSFFSSVTNITDTEVRIFSFYSTKGINGIDGGAIITNNKAIAENARKLVYYEDQQEYENAERYNFRYSNINANVLLANLKRADAIKKKLNQIKIGYVKALRNKKEIALFKNSENNTLQRFVVYFKNETEKTKAVQAFKEKQIALNPFFDWICPEAQKANFKNAQQLVPNSFCIPYFEDLQENEIDAVIKTMQYVFA